MKKLFFVLLSVMAVALTGCKFDNATVTVTVMDKYEDPVPNRYVLYQDKVSAILDLVGPLTPEEIVEGVEDSNWDYVKTDKMDSLGGDTYEVPLKGGITSYNITSKNGSLVMKYFKHFFDSWNSHKLLIKIFYICFCILFTFFNYFIIRDA